MEVKRIRDMVKTGEITVFDKDKGFTIRDLVNGYTDNDDGTTTDNVLGYDRKLNIRPSYQRNSVYGPEKRNAVIETILDKCPLNTMYWVDNGDGTYECLDGQQRTLAICNFVASKSGYSVSHKSFPGDLAQDFDNLKANFDDIAAAVLDYELDIYVCKGTASEKKLWFERINTSGEPLNDQELRNAAHTCRWLSDAKARFSTKTGRGVVLANEHPDTRKSEPLLNGEWNRQDYLKTALMWKAAAEGYVDDQQGKAIDKYMNDQISKADASELWQYFSKVLEWVRSKFTTYDKSLKGLNWGEIYEDYHRGDLDNFIIKEDAPVIQEKIIELIGDDEVTAKMAGIYQYIIYGKESKLNLRQFDEKVARQKYEEQGHRCPHCQREGINKEYAFSEMEADHIDPWRDGGKTIPSNCQMLCRHHNRSKGAN